MRTNAYSVQVDAKGAEPPGPGDKAIGIHTPTLASVGGDASKIDTRTPPATDLLKTDFADVVGKKPVVLTFATPLLCQSRVCGPVVDVVEQVRVRDEGRRGLHPPGDLQGQQGQRPVTPQVAAWRLQSEPWTFVIDRNGVVRTRFEGALSAGELHARWPRSPTRVASVRPGPVAQRPEQRTHNPSDPGSNPGRPMK